MREPLIRSMCIRYPTLTLERQWKLRTKTATTMEFAIEGVCWRYNEFNLQKFI